MPGAGRALDAALDKGRRGCEPSRGVKVMRPSRAALAALALGVVAFAGAQGNPARRALADDGQGTKLRLKAYFAAADADARQAALDALASEPVPAELDRRVRLLRDAQPPSVSPRKAYTRLTEKLALPGGGEVETYTVTPKGYDEKKTYAGLVSLFGHGNSAHLYSLSPFTLPPEVIDDFQKIVDDYNKAHGQTPGRLKRPDLSVPWEDGLVLAPSFYREKDGPEGATLDHVEGDVLALLERSIRTAGLDPDRATLCGLSLGAVYSYQIACRHPDRFAAVLAAAGGAPDWPLENLRPLQVYSTHGAKDAEVNVRVGHEMDARLKECGVTHVFRELPDIGHQWPHPADGAPIRTWLKARVRAPWPRELHHNFDGSPRAGRVFWVELDKGQQGQVDASAKDNEIELTVRGARLLVLHLGEPLVDLGKEVVVRWGGTEVFRGKLERSWKELLADLEGDGFDWPRAAPARLEVKAP